MIFKLLSFFALFSYIQSENQAVAIRGQLECTVEGEDYRDPDLKFSIVNHVDSSEEDLMLEEFVPDGKVWLAASRDRPSQIKPKIWIDHRCGMGKEQLGCFTRTEIFIDEEQINKIYDFGTLSLDETDKPDWNNEIKCEARRKPKNRQTEE